MHVVRSFMKHKRKLAHQLAVFDASNASCQESRDREFILKSISDWYGSIDLFNEQVRGPVREVVLSTIRSGSLTYSAALLCSFMVAMPGGVDYIVASVIA